MDKEVLIAEAATKSKPDATSVVQHKEASLRSRSHAKSTPDGWCE